MDTGLGLLERSALVAALDDPREGPPVEAAGVWPRSLGRHSYVRLTPEQFEAGHEACRLARR